MLSNIFVYRDVDESAGEKDIQDQCLPLHGTCPSLFYILFFLLSSIPKV
jgi:hypothetical protein